MCVLRGNGLTVGRKNFLLGVPFPSGVVGVTELTQLLPCRLARFLLPLPSSQTGLVHQPCLLLTGKVEKGPCILGWSDIFSAAQL